MGARITKTHNRKDPAKLRAQVALPSSSDSIESPESTRSSWKDGVLGYASVCGLVFVWVFKAKLIQTFDFPASGLEFQFMTRYVNMAGYTVLLPIAWATRPPDLQSGSSQGNEHLRLTSLGVNTSLYNTQIVFTLLLSVAFLHEQLDDTKLAGTALFIIGSWLLALDVTRDTLSTNSPLGIFLVLTGALLYGVYQVAYVKKIQPSVTTPDRILLWTGLMGTPFVLLSPILYIVGQGAGLLSSDTINLFLHNPDVHAYLLVSTGCSVGYMLLLLSAVRFRYRANFDKHAPHLNPLEVKGMYYRFSTDLARMPRKAKRNYQYGMVVVEHLFTKYVCLIPLHTKGPAETAQAFALHITARFGCLAEVLTDNGGEWEKDFAQLLKDNLIDHRTTSQSHPQSNGLSERVIRMTKAALTKACAQAGSIDKWDSFLPWIMLGYNATPQESTRLSPYALVYAQRPTLPP
ncbi:hypothetical protein CYMTET_46841 [Cymbomonas tetramitiformis]|uniref:Integrase catalytic domain-containing protein n=1 Tax=Cymbomonas tetramitiformis TaxID=36881 RepID=A0AAE0EYA6_9CHLO|nr:hypothetical protein CYMTET_46841 [Cymbomonas tetramitiformis]